VELLVVLVLLGMMMVMGSTYLRSNYLKAQLTSTVGSVQEFLGSASYLTTKNRGPVFVRLDRVNTADVAGRLQITTDSSGTTVMREMTIPKELTVVSITWPPAASPWAPSPSATYQLEVDTVNRTLNPISGTALMSLATVTITHKEMLSGKLKPRLDYNVQISPLWSVQVPVPKPT
jgi:hypothetical protein